MTAAAILTPNQYSLYVASDAMGRDRGRDPGYFGRWICNLDYEVIVLLVVQLDDYRVVSIVDIVENAATVFVVRACCYEAGDLCAWHPNSVPPTARGFSVDRYARDVGKWNFNAALERPDPVHPFNFEDRATVTDRYVDQAGHLSCRERRKYDVTDSNGTAPGRMDRVLISDGLPAMALDFYDQVLNIVWAYPGDPGYLSKRTRPDLAEFGTSFKGE